MTISYFKNKCKVQTPFWTTIILSKTTKQPQCLFAYQYLLNPNENNQTNVVYDSLSCKQTSTSKSSIKPFPGGPGGPGGPCWPLGPGCPSGPSEPGRPGNPGWPWSPYKRCGITNNTKPMTRGNVWGRDSQRGTDKTVRQRYKESYLWSWLPIHTRLSLLYKTTSHELQH